METEGSSPYSQQATSRLYPQPHNYIHAFSVYCFNSNCHIIRPAMPASSKQSLSFKTLPSVPVRNFFLLDACHIPRPPHSVWVYHPNNSTCSSRSFQRISSIPRPCVAFPNTFILCKEKLLGPRPVPTQKDHPCLLSATGSSAVSQLLSLSRMWDLWWTKCGGHRFFS